MKRALIGFLMILAIAVTGNNTVFAAEPKGESDYQLEAMKYLNEIRNKMGLKPLKLNPYISKAAENHANYVAANKSASTDPHGETEGKPGFTGKTPSDRVKAAGGGQAVSEVMNYSGKGAAGAIDSWLSTAFHRTKLTDPDAVEFGIGIVDDIAVLDIASGQRAENKEIAVYPYEGQSDVDIGFYGFENPNPLEKFNVNKSGYIISFQPNFSYDRFKAVITDSQGGKIPFYQIGTTYLLPAYELAYDELYTVSVDYAVDGVKHNKTWSFRTVKSPFSTVNWKDDIKIKLNGKFIPKLNLPPVVQDGSTFVPLRGIFERLNAEVSWDDATKSVTITKQNMKVKLTIGSKTAGVNGKEITIEQAPFIHDNSTFVPLRFISEAIGAEVGWDGDNHIASIDAALGEPVDVMGKLFAEPKARLDRKVNPIKDISEKFGFTVIAEMEDPDYSNSWNGIYDKNGIKIAGYIQYISKEAASSSIQLNRLSIPQTDLSKFTFIQEAVESLSGMNAPNLASTLAQTLSASPTARQNESRKVEVNAATTCYLSYFQDYKNNRDNYWNIQIEIKTK